MEERTSKIFAVASISFVLASVSGMVLGSLPDFQQTNPNASSESSLQDFRPIDSLEYMEDVSLPPSSSSLQDVYCVVHDRVRLEVHRVHRQVEFREGASEHHRPLHHRALLSGDDGQGGG